MHQLLELRIGDASGSWTDAGFTSFDDAFRVGQTRFALDGTENGRGIRSVAIEGVSAEIDGISTHHASPADHQPGLHPNQITTLDHLVVMTPDCDRTTADLATAGLEARRVRQFELSGSARRQTFFWMGDVILELVGPEVAASDGPAELWGLAFTSADIDATAALLGDRCGKPRAAVQPGRRIATLRTKALGISTAVAIMTPHRNSATDSV